jgi:hypothetical protein
MDHKAHIIGLWNKGFTAGEIAKTLHFTRSKVMGIVQRGQGKGEAVKRPRSKDHKLKTVDPQRTFNFSFDVPIATKKGKTILELRMFDCRWTEDKFTYCAEPVKEKTSWCCKHYDIVYIKNSNIKSSPT